MKKLMMTVLGAAACGAALTAAADRIDSTHRVAWLTSVTNGVYNDAANWTNGEVPANGIDGKYGVIDFRNADITVRAPEGGFTDNSGTIFLGGGSEKHTLTLDTRGTSWTKSGVKAGHNEWVVTFGLDYQNHKALTLTGCITTNNTDEIWSFSDGLLTWASDSTSQEFDLLSGTFAYNKPISIGDMSSGGKMTFRVHPEATFKYTSKQNFSIYGKTPTEVVFLGGNSILYSIWIAHMNTPKGSVAHLVLTNDTSLTTGDAMVGASDNGYTRGAIDAYGTSSLNVDSHMRLGTCWNFKKYPDASNPDKYSNNHGELTLHDQATAYVKTTLHVGYSNSSTGLVVVADNAAFTMGKDNGATYIGAWTNAYGRVTVQDNGTFTYYQAMTLGSDDAASAVLEVKDSGRVVAAGAKATIASASTKSGVSEIRLSDSGVLTAVGIVGSASAESPILAVNANGGTIAVADGLTPSSPFMSGCVVTLGANGLALDDTGKSITIDQSFTDGDSAGAFTKTGSGTLTVARNSSHAKTVVAKGTLCFGAGVTQFGKNLDFKRGTALAFADGASCVEADSLTFDTRLNVILPSNLALGTAHNLIKLATPLTEDQAASILVSGGASDRVYTFSTAADGTLSVTPRAYAPTSVSWTGAAGTGKWNDAGNWSTSATPGAGDAVTLPTTATITVAGVGVADTLTVGAAADVALSGDGALQVASGAAVPEGASLGIGVALLGTSGTFTKSGAGALTVSGDNASEMNKTWNLEGGTTTFASDAAIGADIADADAIAVSNCTFRYTGEKAATTARPVTLTSALPSVFDIVGDLTFDNFKIAYTAQPSGYSNAEGIFVKTGKGALTLNLPEGSTTLGQYGWKSQSKDRVDQWQTAWAPTAAGETTNVVGVGQFAVLDGRCEIVGQGKDKTTLSSLCMVEVGGCSWKAETAPEVVLRKLSASWSNTGGKKVELDPYATASHPGSRLVLDDADLTVLGGIYVGGNRYNPNGETPETIHPVIAVTNGTMLIKGWVSIPNNGVAGNCSPTVRVGKGGVIRHQPDETTKVPGYQSEKPFFLGCRQDLWVEDGGLLEVATRQQLMFNGEASGALHFTRGGGLVTTRIVTVAPEKPSAGTGDPLMMILDGGFIEFTKDGAISANYGERMVPSIRVDAGGGELRVGAGVTHALSMPITGEGALTKTGAGTLVLTNDLGFAGTDEKNISGSDSEGFPIYTYTELGTTKRALANKGGLVVAEGTLVASAGMVPDGTTVSGSGTLSGTFGTLNMSIAPGTTTGLTFKDFTATKVYVDMGVKDTDTPPKAGTETVIAKLADPSAFNARLWKVKNAGAGYKAVLSCSEDGVVTATTTCNGLMLIIR